MSSRGGLGFCDRPLGRLCEASSCLDGVDRALAPVGYVHGMMSTERWAREGRGERNKARHARHAGQQIYAPLCVIARGAVFPVV